MTRRQTPRCSACCRALYMRHVALRALCCTTPLHVAPCRLATWGATLRHSVSTSTAPRGPRCSACLASIYIAPRDLRRATMLHVALHSTHPRCSAPLRAATRRSAPLRAAQRRSAALHGGPVIPWWSACSTSLAMIFRAGRCSAPLCVASLRSPSLARA